MVKHHELPSNEEAERHNCTHATHQAWRRHCNAGLAQRDKRMTKTKKKARRALLELQSNASADAAPQEAHAAGKATHIFKLREKVFYTGEAGHAVATIVAIDEGQQTATVKWDGLGRAPEDYAWADLEPVVVATGAGKRRSRRPRRGSVRRVSLFSNSK